MGLTSSGCFTLFVNFPTFASSKFNTMFFIYRTYEYLLNSKEVKTTLKNESDAKTYTLNIVTIARDFLFMPFGGGLVKISRLYDGEGNLIKSSRYSKELKAQIKEIKKESPIPYFRLWKGFLFVLIALVITSAIMGIKNKIDANDRAETAAQMIVELTNIHPGQIFAASFFTDIEGNNINGLPEGWVRVVKLDKDVLFLQRSKQTVTTAGLFDLEHLVPILPNTEEDWEPVAERFDYRLIKQQLEESPKKSRIDASYIEEDHEKYRGVVIAIKGVKTTYQQ